MIMIRLFKTKIGRLRIVGFLEGVSLLALVFVAVPMKYAFGNPVLSQSIGPVHGALFLLFVLNVVSVGIETGWNFGTATWKVFAACLVPFGTFYIDRKFLKNLETK